MPNHINEMFNTSYATQEYWTPEWDNWAKETLLKCNKMRDENIITNLEWQIIRKRFFSKLGGIIGEMPFGNKLDFMDFLYYNDEE